MVSIWWVLAAFVIGGYAGAVVVALMSMAGIQDRLPEPPSLSRASTPLAEPVNGERRRGRHAPAQAHG